MNAPDDTFDVTAFITRVEPSSDPDAQAAADSAALAEVRSQRRAQFWEWLAAAIGSAVVDVALS